MLVLVAAIPLGSAQSRWIKYSGNPILSPGKLGAWDSGGDYRPRVVYDGQKFRMWYTGLDAGGNTNGIGYASSDDGKTWTKNKDLVLTASADNWEGNYISIGSVIWTGSQFLMWYRGVGGQGGSASAKGAVGLATSQDGITWSKYSGNPVMTASTVDSEGILTPYVIQTGSSYKMWYACTNPLLTYYAICYATSDDGKSWSKYSSPVLKSSTDPTQWDSGALYSPTVVQGGTTFGMWYTGSDAKGETSQVGFATSKNGVTWTKDPNNPTLPVGVSGDWDAGGIGNQCVIEYQQRFFVYYDGSGANQNALNYIGMAQSPSDFALA